MDDLDGALQSLTLLYDTDTFSSLEDDEGQNHLMELSKLAEKDPEFYKYLQENDQELLEFDPNSTRALDEEDADEDEEGDADMEDAGSLPPLTGDILRQWKKALLEQRSLRALRKLLIAFRSAAHMNEEGQVLAWSIESSSSALLTSFIRLTK